jgi:hypothetical protein
MGLSIATYLYSSLLFALFAMPILKDQYNIQNDDIRNSTPFLIGVSLLWPGFLGYLAIKKMKGKSI